MLSEEELILAAAAAGCVLLALGVLRLVRPPDRRDPARRPRPATASTMISATTDNTVKKVRPGAEAVPLPEPGDSSPVGPPSENAWRAGT